MKQKGFTVIELLFVVVLLAGASIIFFVQKNNIQTAAADSQRKTAINAIYYSLEEVYYPAHKSYPQTVDAKILPSVDPALFTDPNGKKIGDGGSNYSYKATDCTDGQCQSYTLSTTLQNEADYTKTNRSH